MIQVKRNSDGKIGTLEEFELVTDEKDIYKLWYDEHTKRNKIRLTIDEYEILGYGGVVVDNTKVIDEIEKRIGNCNKEMDDIEFKGLPYYDSVEAEREAYKSILNLLKGDN